MGGSVNLQGGGQYQTPNIQGYGQGVSNIGRQSTGFQRGIRDNNPQDYGIPPGYDAAGLGMNYDGNYGGNYGNYGGNYGNYGNYGGYGNVSTGGKGFQQQPAYQPAPVMQPYVDQVSSGGKGFRSTPSQSTAYAPMNIPQMQLAQPGFYYPNIGSQMANMNANYGTNNLGAMGAFGNYPMMPRQPAPMQMYPALQPVAPPQTSTGGKGFRSNPPMLPPARPPTQPGIPPVSTGGKGFQPGQPTVPDTPPTREVYSPVMPDIGGVPQDDTYLRPVAPGQPSQPPPLPQSIFVPGYTGPTGNFSPNQPFVPSEERYTRDEPLPEVGNERIDYAPNNPMYAQQEPYGPQYAYAGPTSGPQIAEEYDFMRDRRLPPVEATSPVPEEPYYSPDMSSYQPNLESSVLEQPDRFDERMLVD
ncbi:MAG: hypothetical protein QM523_00295 [Candidatus Pacebacteria bacterium]|nr:hypothetical protein [Candidatus Paceibacterota bacterium]